MTTQRITRSAPEAEEVAREMPLQRSRTNRKIAGVCGGIAEWLGWDPTIVRVLYVLVSIMSAAFPGTIVYLVLWFAMPRAPES